MKILRIIPFFLATSLLVLTYACSERVNPEQVETDKKQNKAAFNETLERHLNAIVTKDLSALKSTLSPEGKMKLIMQGTEIIDSVQGFVDFHEAWFKDSLWTMETKIISTEIGEQIGFAVTEGLYREPERDGKPYFNKMIVSYVLEKTNDKWFVINDHASTIVKSTDEK